MRKLLVVDLGLIEYGAALELQRRVAAARKAGAIPDVLLFCEHTHVITLGRSGNTSNLRVPEEMLRRMGVSFFETNRGGDITQSSRRGVDIGIGNQRSGFLLINIQHRFDCFYIAGQHKELCRCNHRRVGNTQFAHRKPFLG